MKKKTTFLTPLKQKIRNILRELDKNESIRRKIRILRNIQREFPPRNEELIFKSYEYSYPELIFKYTAKGKEYISTINLGNLGKDKIDALDSNIFRKVAFIVGMSLAPYHFLLSDFKSIRVEWAHIGLNARNFYQKYFVKGLAEFRYRQGLNPARHVKVIGAQGNWADSQSILTEDKILMLNGGGKDTAVMVELLKASGIKSSWLNIDLKDTQERIMSTSGILNHINLSFRISPEIWKNAIYPWGHMPYSAVLLSLSLLPALSYKFRYVTTGNEYSSNIGNITYKGIEVNHQYSKSNEFECDFNIFIEDFIGKGIRFFSALRPFYDTQIAYLLSRHRQYFGNFISCNVTDGKEWCNNCPKCAYTYLALSAFTDQKSLIQIFGEDLFKKKRTRFWIRNLITSKVKPWECVGTKEECKLLAFLYFKNNGELNFTEPPYMTELKKGYQDMNIDEALENILFSTQTEHNIPDDIYCAIRKKFKDSFSETEFKQTK